MAFDGTAGLIPPERRGVCVCVGGVTRPAEDKGTVWGGVSEGWVVIMAVSFMTLSQ